MKKHDIYEGIIEKVSFPKKGMMTIEGEKVHIKNVLPSQKVSIKITKIKNGTIEGKVLDMLEPANYEIETDCPHDTLCNGCTLRTMPYDKQLELKSDQVKEIINHYTKDYDFQGIFHGDNQCHYRNKMEYTFGDEYLDGPFAVGLHKKASIYDIVPVTSCKIAPKDFNVLLQFHLDYANKHQLPFYRRSNHVGYLRHLVIRQGEKTGEIMVNLVTTSAGLLDESDYVSNLKNLTLDGTLTSVIHTENNGLADAIVPEDVKILFGDLYIHDKLFNLNFKISPFSFFQTNTGGAERLYDVVKKMVPNQRVNHIYDLYSGTGTITQLLSDKANLVTGVEIVEEAVVAARINAIENGLDNCRFIAGDVLKVIDEIEEKPDLIILDPPREGVSPKALKKILEYGVEHIIYVACKPTSLGKSIPDFIEAGYQLTKLACVDLFPGTYHVETVVMFKR